MTISLGCQTTANVLPPPPLSFWTQGGAWDLTQVAGFDGDPIAAPTIPSLIGSNVLTVSTPAPIIVDTAIGGQRAMLCNITDKSHFECDALAARITAGQAWSLGIEFCVTAGTLPAPLMCAGDSGNAIANYFRIEQVNGVQEIRCSQNSFAHGLTVTNDTTDLQYNWHVLMLRSDGSTITGALDNGAPFSLGAIDAAGFTCDRLAFGAIVSTAVAQGSDVLLSKIYFAYNWLTDAQMVAQTSAWLDEHTTVPYASAPYYCMSGNSETQGDTGNDTGGWRQPIGKFVTDCGMSVYAWGEHAQGWFQFRAHAAQGGADCAGVATVFTDSIANIPGAPSLVINLMGTNNMSGASFPGAQAQYTAAVTAMVAALDGKKPGGHFFWTHLLAFDPSHTPFAANAEAFNTLLDGTIWPALKASYPGRFTVPGDANSWDSRTPIPAYDPALYVDDTHLNSAGFDLEGEQIIETVGHVLRALSPTLNALTVHISSPAPSTVVHIGVPVLIRVGASLWPYTATVLLNGTPIGSVTRTPKSRLATLSWTPTAGQLGAGTLTVFVTDTLDPSSTASSVGVTITVAP